VDDLTENANDFLRFGEQGIECRVEQVTAATDSQSKSRLLGFPESDPVLGDEVIVARCSLGLFGIGAGRRSGRDELVRKCTPDWPSGLQKLRGASRGRSMFKQERGPFAFCLSLWPFAFRL
jgi:hypothetical protein